MKEGWNFNSEEGKTLMRRGNSREPGQQLDMLNFTSDSI
jgi:hypothetical protein